MAKKNIHVDITLDGKSWVAKGAGVRIEAPSLQALRHRLRKTIEELAGAGATFESTLHFPHTLAQRIERNRKRRTEVRAARAALRQDTAEIVDVIRNELGASYEDAADALGVDATGLLRTVRVHNSQNTGGENDD